MKLLKYAFVLILTTVVISACDSLRIEKRRYMKGFYVSSHKKVDVLEKKSNQTLLTAVKEQKNDSAKKLIVLDPIAQINSDKKENSSASSFQSLYKNAAIKKEHNGTFYKSDDQHAFLKQGTSSNSSRNANYFLVGMIALFATAFFAFMKFKKEAAVKLSRWAQKNKRKSKAIMAGLQLLIGVGAHFVGSMLYDFDFTFSNTIRNIIAGTFLAALAFYPLKKLKRFSFSNKGYLKHKIADFALIFTGTLLALCSGNKAAEHFQRHNYEQTISHSKENSNSVFEKVFHLGDSTQNATSADGDRQALKVFLLVLTIFLIVVFEIAIIILSCYLACINQVGLAALALIGGTALLVLAAIFTLKSIHEMEENTNPVSTQ
ncbi:hypothetical protein BH10BAC1_BH10BAC1_11680 [soil metagenome]